MSSFSSFFKAAGIIAAVVVVGIVIGWLGSHQSVPNRISPPPAPTVTATTPAVPMKVETPTKKLRRHSAQPSGTNQSPSEMAGSTNGIPEWEDKIDSILTSEVEDSEKAKQMLELFPRLPEDGQAEVAQHLANLTSDQDYAGLAKYLTNAATPEQVRDVLMADLLNRPNALKLPILLAVARDNQNSKAAEAKDILELFLEEDLGNDWSAWQVKLDQWLKDNPD